MAQRTEHHTGAIHGSRDTETAKVLAGGSSIEGLAGVGAVTLAILGLVGVLPMYMLSISAIAIGGALLLEGASVASRTSQLLSRVGDDRRGELDIKGGATVEFAGGAAGIVLGILALLGIATMTLMPVAALVFGGTLLLSSGTRVSLNQAFAESAAAGTGQVQHAVYEAMSASAGARALVGIASVVLGILVLADIGAAVTLTLVAMLGVGASVLMSGTILSTRVASALRR